MEEPIKKKQRMESNEEAKNVLTDIEQLQGSLLTRCLCTVPESSLRKPFISTTVPLASGGFRMCVLSEWDSNQTLKFLSALQLLCDLAINQNVKGVMCRRVMGICDALARNEYRIIDQIIDLLDTTNMFVSFAASHVLASFFIVARDNARALEGWLVRLTESLANSQLPGQSSLDVFKRVIEHKDYSTHPTEDTSTPPAGCNTICISDVESFNSTRVKAMCVRALESIWGVLGSKFDDIFYEYEHEYEAVVVTYLQLWETVISVKANLSVIDTKPFYYRLNSMVHVLNPNITPRIIWRYVVNLFNEVLCYGSTLALQDTLPDEPCSLAHLIVRAVKDRRLLERIPYRISDRFSDGAGDAGHTLLQKMVLLVLKSVAVTVRETRSDSSDSSLGSEAEELNADMAVIERSIREVLRKLDQCVKMRMPFHPMMPLSRWVVQMFHDQDDFLIEGMVCCLDVAVGLFYRGPPQNDLGDMLSPTHTFIQFISTVSHDPEVLLDLLVSNETCFLLYLLRFLKYIRRNWSEFVSCCNQELDNTMTVLIRLRLAIDRLVSKSLFPYNINPVLRLLEKCEAFYEGNAAN